MPSVRRRGRPPEAEREQRRDAALDAALAEIVERGYEAMSMLDVARRARSSKESLYTWFGNKQGLVAAVIRRESAHTNAALAAALKPDADPRTVLTEVATGLLDLLLGPASLALNRAAMSSPELADVLLQQGRHTTGPLVERYLARLGVREPAEAFTLFYGLVVRDSQIRALLGEPPLTTTSRRRRAGTAVDRFLHLADASGTRVP